MDKEKADMIIYTTEDGLMKVETTFDGDTVWLSIDQMAELFQRDRSVIGKHVRNIFKEGELEKESVWAKFAYTASDAYALFDPADIEAANDILYSQKVTGKQKQRLTFFLQKSKKLLEHYEYETQRQAVADMRGFVRYYEFLLQISSFEDTDLHKKYNFISYLLAYINIKHPGGGFNLDGKIKASQFVQKKGEEHVSSDLVAKPVMKLPTTEHFGLSEDKEKRLSEIIDEINSKTLSSLILMILMMHLLKDCHRIQISFQCCCRMMK